MKDFSDYTLPDALLVLKDYELPEPKCANADALFTKNRVMNAITNPTIHLKEFPLAVASARDSVTGPSMTFEADDKVGDAISFGSDIRYLNGATVYIGPWQSCGASMPACNTRPRRTSH